MTEKMTHQEANLEFAKSSYNQVWTLLEIADRSPSEDEDLMLSAFTSLYHWKQVGTEINLQRGYWMVSKVYQTLGKAGPALEWAEKCAEITAAHPDVMEDFDLAYAQEALARSSALVGDLERAREHYQLAVELGEKIQDPEDRKVFLKDLGMGKRNH